MDNFKIFCEKTKKLLNSQKFQAQWISFLNSLDDNSISDSSSSSDPPAATACNIDMTDPDFNNDTHTLYDANVLTINKFMTNLKLNSPLAADDNLSDQTSFNLASSFLNRSFVNSNLSLNKPDRIKLPECTPPATYDELVLSYTNDKCIFDVKREEDQEEEEMLINSKSKIILATNIPTFPLEPLFPEVNSTRPVVPHISVVTPLSKTIATFSLTHSVTPDDAPSKLVPEMDNQTFSLTHSVTPDDAPSKLVPEMDNQTFPLTHSVSPDDVPPKLMLEMDNQTFPLTHSVLPNDDPPKLVLEKKHFQLTRSPDNDPPELMPHEKRFQCKFCDKSYVSKFSLFSHEYYKHSRSNILKRSLMVSVRPADDDSQIIMSQTNNKLFKCEFCDKSYIAKSSLSSHQSKKHPKRKYLKRLSTAFQPADDSQKLVSKIKLFQCELCDKLYIAKSSLSLHRSKKHPKRKYLKR